MKTFNKKDRGFHWSSKAFYAKADHNEEPQIMFGIYPGSGNEGTFGEMQMKWVDLGSHGMAPQLCCFNDAFVVLESFSDLLCELAKLDSTDYTEDQFVEVLKKCGFRDLTAYTLK